MDDINIHGTPAKGATMRIFKGYKSDEDVTKIHKWMDKVQPTGYTGMVPKGVSPKPPEVEEIYETIEVVDDAEQH